MSRFILAIILIMFSINTASASAMLGGCDMRKMGKEAEASVKVISTPSAVASMPHCHGMAEKHLPKETHPKANHCQCADMCAAKIISPMNTPEFKIISFDVPVSYGEHDIVASIERAPDSPPPKI